MASAKETTPVPTPTDDGLSLLNEVRDLYPQRSKALDILFQKLIETGMTLPCTRIYTVGELEAFLSDKCDNRFYRESKYSGEVTYSATDPDGLGLGIGQSALFGEHDFSRVNVNNLYNSKQAVFLITHPPSGVNSTNGNEPFASLNHHDITPYTDMYGPKLWVQEPRSRRAVPFVLPEQFDHAHTLLDRRGVRRVDHLGQPGESEYYTVFIDRMSQSPHDDPVWSDEEKLMTFVPLEKDNQTFKMGWQVYGITMSPEMIENMSLLLPPSVDSNEPETILHADGSTTTQAGYISFETGWTLFDRHFNKVWVVSTAAGMTATAAVTYLQIQNNPNLLAEWTRLWPNLLSLCCGAPLIWPVVTLAWAIHRDSES